MLNNLFNVPIPDPPTSFERDIDALVQILKNKVSEIYNKNPPYSCMGMWIYGNNYQNQEMLLFKQWADPIVIKYSHSLTEKEPKNINEAYEYLKQQESSNYRNYTNLAVEVAKWICDTKSVSERENLDEVLSEIESLKTRLRNFKDRKSL